MFSVLRRARKSLGKAIFGLATVVLAACQPSVGAGPAMDPGAPVAVALLVPSGSGQASDELLARSIENAARMAISDLGAVRIDLRVYPTAGQPAQAGAAAQKAVAEGAKIILGPVYAEEANAAGVAVASAGVSVLSFSNNPAIAGGNVFVLGPTFENTARRLGSFAVRSGKSKVMIVHDQNAQGEAGRTAIQSGMAAAGGSVVAVGSYEFSQNGIVQAVPAIAAQATGAAEGVGGGVVHRPIVANRSSIDVSPWSPSARWLGGADVPALVAVVDVDFAQTYAHALGIARRIVANLNWKKSPSASLLPPRDPKYAAEELYGVVPMDTRTPYDIREIIARLTPENSANWSSVSPRSTRRRFSRSATCFSKWSSDSII